MPVKICHNCGETVIRLNEKCPRCGIIPRQSTSPVLIGLIAVAALILIVAVGLMLF